MKFNTVKEIVDYFSEQDISLWSENGKLRYKAPSAAISDQRLKILKENKAEIIEYLSNTKHETEIYSAEESRYEPFPLTDIQSAYLLGRKDAFQYGGVSCHVYLEIRYDTLDRKRVQQVWQTLITRHDMLRAIVNENGFQQVLQEVPQLNVEYYNFDSEFNSLQHIREEMGHRIYPPGKWPMFGIAVSEQVNGQIMHFSMEFLIADWTSILLLFSEFEKLYFSKNAKLPEINLAFRDCVLAERRLKNSSTYQKDKQYWINRLPTLPLAPQLPTKRKQSVSVKPEFARYMLRLGTQQWAAFKNHSQNSGITPTVAVLTAYADAVHRWSQNSDFCLNLTVLNRLPLFKEINYVVGDFTSINLLEVKNSAKNTFLQRARSINQTLFADLDHRLFSGVELIREISRTYGKEASLMPVVYTSAIGLTDPGTQRIGQFAEFGITQTPQVFIDCQAMDGDFGLQVNWDVRKGVFPDGMIADMFQKFNNQLIYLAESQENWKQSLHIPLPQWQKAEREEVNNTRRELPGGLLYEKFLEQVEKYPEQLAIDDGIGVLTYRELDCLAKKIAGELVRSGGKKRDNIAIVMKKGRYQVAAVLGILYMGGVYVPVDANQAELRRKKILQNVNCTLILTDSNSKIDNSYKEQMRVIIVDMIKEDIDRFEPAANEPENPAYIIYTSGSTGEPKGVVITHTAARNTIEDIIHRYEFDQHDRVFGISQLNFDLSVFDIFGLLSVGGAIIYPEEQYYMDPAHWITVINKHQVTIWNSVPALMRILLTHLQTKADIQIPLRLAMLSGDWIPLEMPEQLHKFIPGMRIVSLGGATEASIWSIYHEYQLLNRDWISIPYGKPLANQRFMILDEQLRDCPVWKPGYLYIAGIGLSTGYYGDDSLTEAKFIYHPDSNERIYNTGDMGRYLPGGEIEFLGRTDNQVKIRGNRIELGEIENALNEAASISSAVAIVDPGRNEIIALTEVEQIRDYCNLKADNEFLSLAAEIDERIAKETHEIISADIDKAIHSRNDAALYAIYLALQELEFSNNSTAEICSKYQWLMTYWEKHLRKKGYIQGKEISEFSRDISSGGLQEKWNIAYAAWSNGLGSVEILNYIKLNADNLVELLKGNIDPISLLYPEGDTRFARALYVDNPLSAYLNQYIGMFVEKIAHQRPDRRLKIMEIGAGTGATTEYVINALKGSKYQYYFTDVTKYFFPSAKEKFDGTEMIFKTFDLDIDCEEQGFAPNTFDIIICAYVLNNAVDIRKALSRIESLIAPQGYLLFSEPVNEEPWLLASQALMMNPPEDILRQDSLFCSRETWLEVLDQCEEDSVTKIVPDHSFDLSKLGAALFIKQFKRNRRQIDLDLITSQLNSRLPKYMVPADIYFVDQIPLSTNGKIDRKQVRVWVEKIAKANPNDMLIEMPESKLEEEISKLWMEQLNLDSLGKNQNFYDFGADSLIMAQVATKIRNILNVSTPFDAILRQMLNHPTVQETAEFVALEEQRSESELTITEKLPSRDEFAYVKHYGGDLNKRIRLLIHGVLGSADPYRHLAGELVKQDQGGVIAVEIADTEQYCAIAPNDAIEFMADQYANILLSMNVSRAQIIGYSFSGVIAIEVAKRLLEQGIEVDDVSVIDGGSMPIQLQNELMYEILFIDNIHVSLMNLGISDQKLLERAFSKAVEIQLNVLKLIEIAAEDQDRNVIDALQKMSQAERFNLYAKISEENTGRQISSEVITKLYYVFKQSFQALRFIPDPYFGDIRYFSSIEKEGSFKYFDMLLNDWEDICLGEFAKIEIKGNHYSCLEEKENAVQLAVKLGEVLNNE